jgi:hypothetical protein
MRNNNNNNISYSMLQRIPQNGSYFGSIWLGARLADWSGEGSYNLVAYGPPLTKNSFYWW